MLNPSVMTNIKSENKTSISEVVSVGIERLDRRICCQNKTPLAGKRFH